MSLPIAFRKAAQKEFDKAYDWYEQKQDGLGEKFADSVNDVITSIAQLPEMCASGHHRS